MKRRLAAATCLALCAAFAAQSAAEEASPTLTRIRTEAQSGSQVVEYAQYLCDVVGSRLTGSPQLRSAVEWARRRLEAWGLKNVRLERWGPFGSGWTAERVVLHMVEPERAPLIALARAWSPGTNGVTRGRAVRLDVASEEDLVRHHGRLAGRVVLLDPPTVIRPRDSPPIARWTEQQLIELGKPQPSAAAPQDDNALARLRLRSAVNRFLHAEHALMTLASGQREGGTIAVTSFEDSLQGRAEPAVPGLIVAAEHYNRIVRLVERGVNVELEAEIGVRWHHDDPMCDNLIAELPGADLADEVVMLGAHLDSWHGGSGATDNAAGVSVAMESMRLLLASGARPRRTIRLALFTGEEQGLLGSRAYVKRHFGWRDEPKDSRVAELPYYLRSDSGRLHLGPDHERLYAYFNIDYGTGRIRGIYLQGRMQAAPLVSQWLAPLSDLGVAVVSPRSMRGSDHQPFDAVGLPAFMFIHDEIEYSSRSYHTNMDLCERLMPEDLLQASIVAASVAHQAAMCSAAMPRNPPKNGDGGR